MPPKSPKVVCEKGAHYHNYACSWSLIFDRVKLNQNLEKSPSMKEGLDGHRSISGLVYGAHM